MKPSPKMWRNNRILPLSKSASFTFHQGLNYGACVYEGIRFYDTKNGPALFRLKEHVARFLYSASVLRMKPPLRARSVEEAIKKVIRQNKLRSGYVRPMAYYSEAKMGINVIGSKITFDVFVWKWKDVIREKPVTLGISKLRRLDPETVDLKAKISGYYANGILGFIDARERGFDEPLFLDTRGFVAEGAVNNIFVVKKGIIYTPPLTNILAGITRDTVIEIARGLGYTVREKLFLPEFLSGAEEIFLTGTGIELKSVSRIDRFFSGGPAKGHVNIAVSECYRAATRGDLPRYKKWLTPIA